ncbi:MAG: AMP-dependent synthetase [Ruminococcaceae bacterium]|nr:AMP-dependent synthetase [Oscillospiraceae bacterium]
MKKYDYMPKAISSVRDIMEIAKKDVPDKTAYRYIGEDGEIVNVSYSSFYNKTQALGAAICELGLVSSHIACVGENSYNWIVVYLTALQSAGVFLPVDKDLPSAEMLHVLTAGEADIIFYDEKREAWLMEHRDELPKIKYFVGFDRTEDKGDFLSFSKFVRHGKTLDTTEFKRAKRDENEMKMLVYTSGTTGVAKGVMLTEHNLVSMVYYGLQTSHMYEVGLSVLPYHHTYESVVDILVGIHYHSTICINDSIKNVRKNLDLFKPDFIYLVPAFAEAFYNNVMKNIKKSGKEKTLERGIKLSRALLKMGIDRRREIFRDIHRAFGGNLLRIGCGGAPIRTEIAQFFNDIGIIFSNGYGITECCPLVSLTTVENDRIGTAGIRIKCLDCRIDNPDEEGIGEICVKGDTVMKGYYNAPDKTAEVMKDGWFYTGDYGKLDNDGMLVITGRKKNIIVLTNGKNIYPEELEEYIQGIDYVCEVIVKAIKNEHGSETGLMAEIYPYEPQDETKVALDVKNALAELPSYKQISKIVMRDEPFVKNTTNKIKREYK